MKMSENQEKGKEEDYLRLGGAVAVVLGLGNAEKGEASPAVEVGYRSGGGGGRRSEGFVGSNTEQWFGFPLTGSSGEAQIRIEEERAHGRLRWFISDRSHSLS
ncbi:hypothetical protein Droror1_Dr00025490 [Drosera rotundifolia]